MTEDRKNIIVSVLFLAAAALGRAVLGNSYGFSALAGAAWVILILWLGRRGSRRAFAVTAVSLSVAYFAFTGFKNLRWHSAVVLLSMAPYFRINSMRKKQNLGFNRECCQLNQKHDSADKKYRTEEKRNSRLENEINRMSRLYEISREIEKVLRSDELISKALDSLSIKIGVANLAFYKAVKQNYEVLQVRGTDPETAKAWLDNTGGSRKEIHRFVLKAGRKNLGLIICEARLSAKKIREAEVLVSQITLGYEKTALYERVRELARIDGLTGLYLRRYFLERLDEEIKRATRDRYQIAFIMADLDDFKKYNDTYGHLMGDKLLSEIGAIIKNSIYSSDFAGRYGGEEFSIYMPMAEKKGTLKKAWTIRKLVEEKTPITVSLGISYFPAHGKNIQGLIEASDGALYQAKQKGKNQISETP
jgi:diguanylate cyclase (GGDEF)-like protein